MRKYLLPLVLSLSFLAPSMVYADHHDHDHYRHERKERHHDRRDREKEWKKERKEREKKWAKAQKKREKEYRKAQEKRYKHYRHSRKHRHHDNLGYLVGRATRGGRNAMVWYVGGDTYVVKYIKGGHHYMRYIYPNSGRYGGAVRLVADGPGWWYQHGNRHRRYREDRNGLRLYLNGTPQNPWQLIPSFELNISL